jgi:adenylate cyclase
MNRTLHFAILFLVVIGFTSIIASGQMQGNSRLDSLLGELNSEKYKNVEDSNKVKLLTSILWANSAISMDEAMRYADIGLKLTKKIKWKKGESDMYNSMGKCYASKSDNANAIIFYKKALEINMEIGNSIGVAANLCNIGIITLNTGDHAAALEYYFKALKLDRELGLKKYTANVLSNIGVVYSLQGNGIVGLKYYIEALAINESMNDSAGMASNLDNIGIVYYTLKDYDKALEYYQKALATYEALKDINGTIIASYNIGSVYNDRQDLTNALVYFERSLQSSTSSGIKSYFSSITGSIGEVYTKLKDYKEAVVYYNIALKNAEETGDKGAQCLTLHQKGAMYLDVLNELQTNKVLKTNNTSYAQHLTGREMSQFAETIPASKNVLLNNAIVVLTKSLAIAKEVNEPGNISAAYKNLAKAYKLMGNSSLALDATEHFMVIQDSLFSQENRQSIVKMGLKNEYDRKHLADSLHAAEKQRLVTLKLQKQRSYTYMGVAGILLLAGFSFFIVKERGKSEKARKQSDELLLNILPEEVAAELKIMGTTTAKHYDNVTVLFTDFVNFTQASENMGAQNLIDELHACFKTFDEIMEKYNIEKIKTIGDAYLAVAGLPTADPKHAENVIKAAKEITAFMEDRLGKMGTERTFQIRVGIHSGTVVAGIVGVKKFAYDIWGDTVNTAARMEQNSEAGKINISQTTYELVKDKFACEYRGEVEVKGKGVMKMYYVE